MKLFHYTTEQGRDWIFTDGWIDLSPNITAVPGWISLTSDPDPVGHGLPDGRPITQQQAQQIPHALINGQLYCHDHTAVRLTIDFNANDPHLIKADLYHSADDLWGLDIAGYHPDYKELPDDLLFPTFGMLKQGVIPRKSPTWWYYKERILVSRIAMIEIRDAHGTYVSI